MAKYLIDEYGEMLGEFKDDVSLRVYNPLNIKRRFIENKLFYKLYKDCSYFLKRKYDKFLPIIQETEWVQLRKFSQGEAKP